MGKLEERDYFTDYEVLKDPYDFFEAVRSNGPVYQPPGKDYLIVTGFEETVEVLNNNRDFSAVIGVAGAAAPLPFTPEGPDISEQLEENRAQILAGEFIVNLDDAPHTNMRALVNRLFTPSRLKANQEFITDYSDAMVRDAVAQGDIELMKTVSTPFVTMVIADLLGVPPEDREHFMRIIEAAPPPGSLESDQNDFSGDDHPMVAMAGYFVRYLTERLEHPQDDILSELAHADYPDGTKPNLGDLVTLANFIFGAGQDTSAKLLGNAMRYIADVPGLQDRLRQDTSLIPAMIEEVLRLEGSTKQTARLTRRDSKIGDLHVPAGTKILLALSAANRDPKRWPDPEAFILDRPRIKEHVGFGRGKHVCAGAPLARVEVRIILELFFKYTSNIDIDDRRHGPRGSRDFDFDPSFIIRGLSELHLRLTPAT